MLRQARLDAPGTLHHVIARGIERREIFLSAVDYGDFLARRVAFTVNRAAHREMTSLSKRLAAEVKTRIS